jgi:hypothetical protein
LLGVAPRARISGVAYRVFAQTPRAEVDVATIVNNARRYFEAEVEVLDADAPQPSTVRLELRSPRRGYSGRFRLTARAVEPADLELANQAEQRGRAAGMAALASRCPTVWLIDAEPPESKAATLNLCALLASVALGPVLPDDASTLFGVRGAMLRVEELLGEHTLLR